MRELVKSRIGLQKNLKWRFFLATGLKTFGRPMFILWGLYPMCAPGKNL